MNYRTVKRTGLRISEIGFGAGDNAGLMISGTLEEQCKALDRALELGITYVDTAPRYGDRMSETNLGRVFKELRVRPIINSKVEVMPDDVGDIASAVVNSVEESLQRLGIDCLDSVMIQNTPVFARAGDWDARQNHEIPYYLRSPIPLTLGDFLGPKGAAEGLHRLQQAGKIRFTGVTFIAGLDLPVARAVVASGEFAVVNVTYNLMNPTAGMPKPRGLQVDVEYGQIIDYASEHGCGIAIISPLARGVLTNQALADGSRHRLAGTSVVRNPDAYQHLLQQARTFGFLAHEGRTLGQAAIRFLLGHPGVTTVLGGFTAVEQIEEMVTASSAPPLSDEDYARIELAWRSNLGDL